MSQNLGGFLAIAACGCTIGWQADVDTHEDQRQIAEWLRAGCTIKPLKFGQDFKRERCAEHPGGGGE